MRVISGSAKKTILKAPGTNLVRPTSDRVKEGLFNILGSVADVEVLDLFAGSGAVGIEALSRGGKSCDFVEKSPKVAKVIKSNLDKTRLSNNAAVIIGDVKKKLYSFFKKDRSFDLIFMDPPYVQDTYDILKLIAEKNLLKTTGVVVVESQKNKLMYNNVSILHGYRTAVYGNTMLTFYSLENEEGEIT
ncbi:MAG: 16S rRNA (guanine(966)-N(2))-methyltransferase RsmD [Clostridiales bacterium]|nr:16S rRNA (guanine(966)-N(2))-methyltransferase RsmD [Clostridiales bacterium]MCF8022581.1 16S rRNA (guanine(966)-N(2))-methyltransferase RsmD [Clostridiales bacterium]